MKVKTTNVNRYSLPCIILLFHSYWIQYFTSQMMINIIYILSLGMLIVASFKTVSIKKKVFLIMGLWLWIALLSVINNWDMRNGRCFSALNFPILVFIMVLLSQTTMYFEPIMKFIKAMALLFAFFTILMFIGHLILPENLFFENYKSSITSAHYSSNAVYLSFGSIIIWSHYMIKRTKGYLCQLFFILTALFITGKRACFIFTCVTMLFLFLFFSEFTIFTKIQKIVKVLIILALAIPVATMIIPQLGNMIDRIKYFFYSDKSFGNRVGLYSIAINMLKSNPYFGVGWGAYKFYFDNMNFTWQYDGSNLLNAHNVYLQVFAESGILGGFIYIAVLMKTLENTLKRGKCDKKNVYLIFTTGIQIYYLLYSITGNPLYDTMFNVTYFMALGMSYSLMNIKLGTSMSIIGLKNNKKKMKG